MAELGEGTAKSVGAVAEHGPAAGNVGLKGHWSFSCDRRHLQGGVTAEILSLENLEEMRSTAGSNQRTN